jgi:hypothetical protein
VQSTTALEHSTNRTYALYARLFPALHFTLHEDWALKTLGDLLAGRVLQPLLPPLVPAADCAAATAEGVDVGAAGYCYGLAAAGIAAAAVYVAGSGRMRIVAQQMTHQLQLAKAIASLVEPAD